MAMPDETMEILQQTLNAAREQARAESERLSVEKQRMEAEKSRLEQLQRSNDIKESKQKVLEQIIAEIMVLQKDIRLLITKVQAALDQKNLEDSVSRLAKSFGSGLGSLAQALVMMNNTFNTILPIIIGSKDVNQDHVLSELKSNNKTLTKLIESALKRSDFNVDTGTKFDIAGDMSAGDVGGKIDK